MATVRADLGRFRRYAVWARETARKWASRPSMAEAHAKMAEAYDALADAFGEART